MSYLYPEESYQIIGAAMEVYNKLGSGFLEQVYQEALEIEFKKRGIQYEREKDIKIKYDGIELNKSYKADFVCYEKIIVELKAVSAIESSHIAQTNNYLKATGIRVGLLINFGGYPDLKIKRVVR